MKEYGQETDDNIYLKFTKQLRRNVERRYITKLSWKPAAQQLLSNESRRTVGLRSFIKKLERNPELLDKYEQIIPGQLKERIIKKDRSRTNW